jgi:hypothetical protein
MSVLLIPPLTGVPVIVRQVIPLSDCRGTYRSLKGDVRGLPIKDFGDG